MLQTSFVGRHTEPDEPSDKAELWWFVFGVIAWLPLALLSAWIRTRIWNWFLVPYFEAPTVSVLAMLGLGMFVGCFTATKFSKKPLPIITRISHLVIEIVGALCAYWGAYLLHLYLTR